VAITGVAGPDGGTPEKPVGLVYLAAGRRDGPVKSEAVMFGDLGRTEVQRASVAHALKMLRALL
jgi:nicotinamide-nucleotide amidase